MGNDHIVRSYDEELNRLTGLLARMGGLVEAELAGAIEAVSSRDAELATRTVRSDARVDDLEREIGEHDGCAGLTQASCIDRADATGTAGDDRHFAGQVEEFW